MTYEKAVTLHLMFKRHVILAFQKTHNLTVTSNISYKSTSVFILRTYFFHNFLIILYMIPWASIVIAIITVETHVVL